MLAERFTTSEVKLNRICRIYFDNNKEALNMFPYSNEDISVDIEEEEEGSSYGPKSIGKESRGHTYMKDIWGRPPNLPLISVEYNEFDVNNWHAMSRGKKVEMLEVVKLRFTIPIIAEKWVLAYIGVKWRSWKHYLKKTSYWADVPIEHLIHDKDDRVLEDQWIKCLAYWRREDAKVYSSFSLCNDISFKL
ncbi:hypothetical protein SASPL_123254 [Salvia splendens]|uniref:Uncharacterized protein n=1 Tax=Salvia splendens TaxID=180675 RepID=A0A8X8XPH3_SALSN|nr:hypothetical protein SASPL_123254 [Salvia splendens]